MEMLVKNKPTKHYSSLQEKTIADYLGWSAVSASGARPFTKGDIKSCDWLAECKTHTSETDIITITKSVWKKISIEAKGAMRKPVLFIDNGTQDIQFTYAVVPKRVCYGYPLHKVDADIKESQLKFTFSHTAVNKLLSVQFTYLPISLQNESLYIMKLDSFKHIIVGE
jgi:hypothetical protein